MNNPYDLPILDELNDKTDTGHTHQTTDITDLSSNYLQLSGGTMTGAVTSSSTFSATGFYETSDQRKKEILGELDLDRAYSLVDKCSEILYKLHDDSRVQVGMIAQEVEEIFPELINTDLDGYKSLDYSRLCVVVLRILKDLITRIKKLEEDGKL